MNRNKIAPSLWFSANGSTLSDVLDYYKKIFSHNFLHQPIVTLNNTPGGKAEISEATLFSQPYLLMCTGQPHEPFNDAVSFVINCEDQNEIDKYWNAITKEGRESQCGWCTDKFGLRWQVVPHNMKELMSRPGAFDVMLKQRKIIIAEYLK